MAHVPRAVLAMARAPSRMEAVATVVVTADWVMRDARRGTGPVVVHRTVVQRILARGFGTGDGDGDGDSDRGGAGSGDGAGAGSAVGVTVADGAEGAVSHVLRDAFTVKV